MKPDQVVPERFMRLYRPMTDVRAMLELGNKREKGRTYKRYFAGRGIRHVSVDANGRDGALRLDLRRPLRLGRFDMVTNIGTSEHVDDQAGVWRNICEALDWGGILVSATPAPGSCAGHGLHYPGEAFYRRLAELNGLSIEQLFSEGPPEKTYVYARLRRVADVPFAMPDLSLIHREQARDKYTDAVRRTFGC